MTIVDSALIPDEDTIRARWADSLADELGVDRHRTRHLVELAARTHRGDSLKAVDIVRRVIVESGGTNPAAFRRIFLAGSEGLREWRGSGETFLGSFPSGVGTDNFQPQMTVVRGSSIPVLVGHTGPPVGHTVGHRQRGDFVEIWFKVNDPGLRERAQFGELSCSPAIRTGDHRLEELSIVEVGGARIAAAFVEARGVPYEVPAHTGQPDQWSHDGMMRSRTVHSVVDGRVEAAVELERAVRGRDGLRRWPDGSAMQYR